MKDAVVAAVTVTVYWLSVAWLQTLVLPMIPAIACFTLLLLLSPFADCWQTRFFKLIIQTLGFRTIGLLLLALVISAISAIFIGHVPGILVGVYLVQFSLHQDERLLLAVAILALVISWLSLDWSELIAKEAATISFGLLLSALMMRLFQLWSRSGVGWKLWLLLDQAWLSGND